jgi:glycosyltransferase involved in cell wall biosynthesis
MRICYFADGRSIHFHRWIRFFASAGHEMSFVSSQPVTQAQVKAIEFAGARYLGTVGAFYIKRFWRTRAGLQSLKKTLKRERIDVLHCHFLGVNAWYGALSGHHPLVITVMGGGDVCGPDWRPEGRAARYFIPMALRRADLITSWSPLIAKVVRPYCRATTPVEVLHGGIDLGLFHPGPQPQYLYERWKIPVGASVIFSPRLMRPLSNLHRIAEAAVQICARRADVYFLFAYPVNDAVTQYEAQVREIINQSPAADRVRFIGTVPHNEMADHYRLASVTVSIPSTDGTPMSVLESMACGTPAIAGDIPDYDEYYFDRDATVVAVDPNDSDSISTAILRLLDDPSLVQKLTREALLRVQRKGSYQAQMSHLNHLYENLRPNLTRDNQHVEASI